MPCSVSPTASAVRMASAISGGVNPFGVRYLRTNGTLVAFSPRKFSPLDRALAVAGTPGTMAALRTVPPITGRSTSPAALNIAPSRPSRNLLRRRTPASAIPVMPSSSSVRNCSGIASQLSARDVLVLGETRKSATPVPAVVRTARPACVFAKLLFLPNSTADFPNQVLAAGSAVPALTAAEAFPALLTQPKTGIAAEP